MPLITRRRVTAERMMVARVELEPGFTLASHCHENEQIVIVLHGKCRFGLGTPGTPEHRELVVGAGEVLVLPANLPHSCVALEATTILDLFSPPSERTGVDACPAPEAASATKVAPARGAT
ncbi:MAG TPA: cupin domain-containing protein [Phycisphaerales bacterium]|nr:cupin domain-containing protein [Phycisphaerales bacterium]